MATISAQRLLELERIEQEFRAMVGREGVRWVGARMGEVYATHLASKPWEKWTPQEKMLLHAVCNGAQSALRIYQDALPKGDE